MTWQEFAVARTFLMEERVGTASREARSQEDAIFERSKKALQQMSKAR